jgi:1-deoxyxylulose-5-phosphate synthase
MEYKRLGRTGLTVSRICLGTTFRTQLFKAGFDGRSEEVLGEALRGKRDRVVLATKVAAQVRDDPGPNDQGLSRYHILREVEHSLRRLRTDHVDIYWVHQRDAQTPIDETLRALDDLVRQGKVRYIGCCNFPAWRVCEALWRSDARNLNAFVAVQNSYNLLGRTDMEPDLLALCAEFGLGVVTYSPLAIGLLSGRYKRGEAPPAGTPWADEAHYRARYEQIMTPQAAAVFEALEQIARAHDRTPAQTAVAWLLKHPALTSVICGPDLPEHVDDVAGACGWELDEASYQQLEQLSRPTERQSFA